MMQEETLGLLGSHLNKDVVICIRTSPSFEVNFGLHSSDQMSALEAWNSILHSDIVQQRGKVLESCFLIMSSCALLLFQGNPPLSDIFTKQPLPAVGVSLFDAKKAYVTFAFLKLLIKVVLMLHWKFFLYNKDGEKEAHNNSLKGDCNNVGVGLLSQITVLGWEVMASRHARGDSD